MKLSRTFSTMAAGVAAVAVSLGGALPSGAAETPEPGVILSSDFEGGSTAPWSKMGNPTLAISTDAHAGAGAMLVSGRTAGYEGPGLEVKSRFVAGETYDISFMAKLAADTVGSSVVKATVKETASGEDNYADATTATTVTADGWVEVSGSYPMPTGLSAAQLYIEASAIGEAPDAVNPSFLIDDVTIEGLPVVVEPGDPSDPDFVLGGAVDPTETPVSAARGSGNVAALTFDDGPNGEVTAELLDFLKLNRLPATFCVIGTNIENGGADLLRRMVDEGHTLCNHTTGYADMGSWTAEQIRADLKENLEIIRTALGDPNAKVPYFRAPNGSWGVSQPVAVELGMQPLAVTNTIEDWATQDVDTLTDNLRASMKAGEIVLVHDGGDVNRSGSLAATRTVVSERLAQGWAFTLPQGGVPGGDTVPLSNDFENDLGPWGARGSETVALSAVQAHGGSQSALVSNRAEAWHGLGADVTTAFERGAPYAISAWVRLAEGAEPADMRLSIARTIGADTSYDTIQTITGVTADAWTKVEVTYSMGDADSALLYFESATSLADFYVDDIIITRPALSIQTDIPSIKDEVPFPFGVAIDSRETAGVPSELVLKHFNQITAENAMKPEAVQPTEGEFTFDQGDQLIDYAIANGLRVFGHTLVWYSQTPDWFFNHTDGTPLTNSPADQEILRDRMRTHITTIAEHYRTKYGEFGTEGNPIVGYDVVNEVIAESEADGMRRSRWFDVLGEEFVDLAFEYADEAFNKGVADGPVKLFINDYNTELPAKRQAYFDFISRLIARDAPIDGIGHQFHVSLAQPVAPMRASLEKLGSLGLLQDVSEFDAPIDGTVSRNLRIKQGYYYADVFDMLRSYHAENPLWSVTLWGPYDSRSWREGEPLVFDDNLQAKPAYWGIVDRTQLPVLTNQVNVHQSSGTLDAAEWAKIPPFVIGDGSGFQARWSDEGLAARVVVAAAPDAGAQDTVDVFVGAEKVTVDRTDAETVPGGYAVVVEVPVTGLAKGGTVAFDVRITDGATETQNSWNDLTNKQETSKQLGVLALIEKVAYVEVPQARTVPVIDGEIDATWADANVFTTTTQVEGTGGASADVRVLWSEGKLNALFEVTDPTLDKGSSNAWEQDSIEFFVNPGNTKAGAYAPADGQYRVNFANDVSVSGDLAVIGDNLTSATKTVDGGYVVELSIKLSEAELDALVGIEAQVNDGTAGARTAVRSWVDPTGRSYQDTSRWGVAKLVGPSDAPITVAPVVTTQPKSATVANGASVTFTAAASGTPAPSVAWERKLVGGAWTTVAGATSGSLTVTATAALDKAQYRAVFTNTAGTAASSAATLTVTPDAPVTVAPKVASQPASVTAKLGATASFTATATGTPAPTVAWERKLVGKPWTAVKGATSTTLKVAVTKGVHKAQYRAVFTNSSGKAVSKAATLTVKPVATKITSHPKSVKAALGKTVTFKAKATGFPTPKVSWQRKLAGKSWTTLKGKKSTTLKVKVTKGTHKAQYRAVFTTSSAKKKVYTKAATLTVKAQSPKIVKNPQSVTKRLGSTATFRASATGFPTPKVTWQHKLLGGTWTTITGATKTTLTVRVTGATHDAQYRAVFTGNKKKSVTKPATLRVAGWR